MGAWVAAFVGAVIGLFVLTLLLASYALEVASGGWPVVVASVAWVAFIAIAARYLI